MGGGGSHRISKHRQTPFLFMHLQPNIQGVQTKLSRTLGPHCRRTNYRSITCSINSESYTHVLSISTLIVVMPSSYEDLDGYKWEDVDLRSAADFMTKLPQSP